MTIVKATIHPSETIKFYRMDQIEKPIADLLATPLGQVIQSLTVTLPSGGGVTYELTDLKDIPDGGWEA